MNFGACIPVGFFVVVEAVVVARVGAAVVVVGPSPVNAQSNWG